jgi:LysM repeat protein/lysophospholipase L1-like esterase
MSKILLLFLVLNCTFVSAQISDSIDVEVDSVSVDSLLVDLAEVESIPSNKLYNAKALDAFFEKLDAVHYSVNSKINIVHIGDSHIQADLQTDSTRRMLQSRFGNGGRGFVFPHRLAGTNGSSDLLFSSSVKWNSYRIISPPGSKPVGLGGFALDTPARDFYMKVGVKDRQDYFSRMKVITPSNSNKFNLAFESKTSFTEVTLPQSTTHTVRKGEVLSVIAEKYKVSLTSLKKANGLKNNIIREGRKLKIPTTQFVPRSVSKSEFVPLQFVDEGTLQSFTHSAETDHFFLLPADSSSAALSGIVLQNDRPGLLYHNIGVNGAKLSDYNKTPLFFEQLPVLQPDLIVIALGTNESFDNLPADSYLKQLVDFIKNVRSTCANADILVMTPPPSQFKRKYPNNFVADYAKSISEFADEHGYAVWDLFRQLGGKEGILDNTRRGVIGQDRVHYTRKGYEIQGNWFAQVLIDGFENFKRSKQ